jgi:hypothetical protein
MFLKNVTKNRIPSLGQTSAIIQHSSEKNKPSVYEKKPRAFAWHFWLPLLPKVSFAVQCPPEGSLRHKIDCLPQTPNTLGAGQVPS